MKKKWNYVMSALILTLCMWALIGEREANAASGDFRQVVDEADLLTDEEERQLDDEISQIVTARSFDIVILTVPGLEGKSTESYADDYYDENGYGMGEDKDGVLFLVSMEDHDYYTSTCGYGLDAFTDYGIEEIGDHVASYLSDEEYFDGFEKFVSMTEEYLDAAEAGTPYDVDNKYEDPKNYFLRELIALVVSLGIGFVCVMVMKSQMNTARPQTQAASYEKDGSYELTRQRDTFMYMNVTREKKAEKSSGGSSSHTSSGGATHGGGGGKF
ncbi:MAG: TPM domain-containing protein [Hespellia sp.]|nr:TPM domain-containing protein [Hespellia sp.]